MKAVTIAKIARTIVMIAVAVVIAIPTFAGFETIQVNGGEFVMTDSVYEVTHMTSNDLASNIKDVTNGGSGYTIAYGNVIGREVPTDDADIKTMCDEIVAAVPVGAESFEATLFDSEGKTTKQQMIMGSNGLTQYITTGLKLTGSMVNMVTPSVTLESVMNGSRNTISNADIKSVDDSYRITIPIPYLMFATALAGMDQDIPENERAKLGLTIGIEYNSFFEATFKMDLPMDKFIQSEGGSLPEIDCEVRKNIDYDGNDPTLIGTPVAEEIYIDAKMSGLSNITARLGDFGAGDGGIRVEVNDDGKVQLMTDDEVGLVEALKKNIDEETGTITLNIDSDNPEIPSEFTIEKEYVDSFLSMSDDLIKILEALSS